ncbi:glutathione S-transferase family protein [Caldimonas tepidiphila]|uniref:glutathione S-transferase family protein n=1 Tax=Caldimonas tepidiphila TaxID=2315841 RepID=UPI000E5B8D5C|nr:glutathione S-transferase [Caldimonas tepidiphila]
MLKILGKSSSINVRKVLWTCEELGLPYEQQQWGSGFRPTETEEFKALNPNAMVPVLIDGEFVLWESNAICRYLAGRQECDRLLPSDLRQRALVEQWMDWQATELNNSWRYAFMALIRHSAAHADAAAIAASVEGWNRHMGIVEAQLRRTGAYMTGETFTLADVVVGLSVNRWFMTPMQRPAYPAVAAYHERLDARPGYRAHGRNGTP